MKFRFCGDGDCPDWVLGEIISTLSVLDSSKLEFLASLVAKRIIGQELEEDAIKTHTKEIGNDGKTLVACIYYLLINATRHSVSESVFNEEIQQLGLPKEHAAAMCRVLAANVESIRQELRERCLKINELSSVKVLPTPGDAIDCATLELKIKQLLLNDLPEDSSLIVNIDRPHLKTLIEELKEALNLMDNYEKQ